MILIKTLRIFMMKQKYIILIKKSVYQEVLRDISQNFEGTEEFIKERIQEICDRKKISEEEVIYFFKYVKAYVLSVIACY